MMQPFHVNNILLFTATITSLIPRGSDAFMCHVRCNNINTRHDTSLCSLNQQRRGRFTSDLDTALEWLAKERQIHDSDNTFPIHWFDIDDDKTGSHVDVEDTSNLLRVPLYPLNAVYTPHSGENHTLVNTEPRNVKMTADIVAGKWDRSLFCVTLRARDTNRLASVGTLCRLIDTEDRSISGARTWPGDVLPTLNRVVVTCEAVGIVDIVSVENGDSNKYSIDEYKVARVRLRSFANDSTKGKTEEMDSLTQQIVNDYGKVRETYINSQSLASNELPKFARKAVHALPTFEKLDDELDFWKLVDTWQVLCNTIRQSKLIQLQGLINELTVQVAMQTKKGPLELPVKRQSLPEDVQKQLDEMEQSAACDYAELGMEPILDFQELISMECSVDRFRKLGAMIKRERSRLEAKESLIKAFLKELD